MDNNFSMNGLPEIDDNANRTVDIERVKAAKKRRSIQLKKFYQYDKLKDKEEQIRYKKGFPSIRRGAKGVRFHQNLILLEASNREDIDEVRRLLREGVCADVANDDGLTALHQCAINNSIELCQVLIQHRANVNAKDKELWTPLHAASICGHREICLLLIKSGADLMALNADGNMPYDICDDDQCLDELECAMSSRGITQEMIDETRGLPERRMLADLRSMVGRHNISTCVTSFSQLDKQGATMLHICAAMGYVEVARFLVGQLGMPMNLLDKDGWQPIHCAALYGHLDVVQYLVSQGANLDALTEPGGETVYELVFDQNVYDQLLLLKREVERLQRSNKATTVNNQTEEQRNITNSSFTSSFGLVRRRSSTNPRSASIRRSSMKEKSNLSWKEARQEAEIRLSLERKDNSTNPNGNSLSSSDTQPGNHGKLRPHNNSENGVQLNNNVIDNKMANVEEFDEADYDDDNNVSLSRIKVDLPPEPVRTTSSNSLASNGPVTATGNNKSKAPRLVNTNQAHFAPPRAPTIAAAAAAANQNNNIASLPQPLKRSQENLSSSSSAHHPHTKKSPTVLPRHHPASSINNNPSSNPHHIQNERYSQLSMKSNASSSSRTTPINSTPKSSQESVRRHPRDNTLPYVSHSNHNNHKTPIPIRPTNQKSHKGRPDSCCSVM